MIQQVVRGRSVSRGAGLLIVAGLAVSIVLVSWIERAVAMTTGFQYGAFAVWALVVAEAVAIVRLSVMAYRYTVSDGRFFIERVYGDHARIVHSVQLNRVLAVGPRDEIFRRFGNAQAYDRAVIKKAEFPEKALAYAAEGGGAARLLVFQPNEEILAALEKAALENAE